MPAGFARDIAEKVLDDTATVPGLEAVLLRHSIRSRQPEHESNQIGCRCGTVLTIEPGLAFVERHKGFTAAHQAHLDEVGREYRGEVVELIAAGASTGYNQGWSASRAVA